MGRAARSAGSIALGLGLLTAGCTANSGPEPASPPPATSEVVPGSTAAASQPGSTRPSTSAPAPPTSTKPPELPRGGRVIFPDYRLVGFAGHPHSSALGRLGVGDLDDRAREIEKVAGPLAGGRKPLPVLELIATVVQGSPGRDGRYRARASDALVSEYLAAARRVDGLLLLDIQPGRSDFLTEVRYYAKWLREPDVGVALDPEWAMGPGQVPMRVFGHTTGKQIDAVARYLSGIVKANDLPQKALVFHQLAPSIVRDEKAIRARDGVAIIKSVDGIGSRSMKLDTYRKLTRDVPRAVHAGFKLFFDEDARYGKLMTPGQVLALKPRPEYVLYE